MSPKRPGFIIAIIACLFGIIHTFELNQGGNTSAPTPGLSGSFDYSDFKSFREPLLRNILNLINNMTLPNFPIGTDGSYMNGNSIFI
jgi:hypothetical protein